MVGGRDAPAGYPWSDLQQYYLDARKADRQQNDNMKSTQGILEAITQSTRFATAEIWHVHGAAPSADRGGNNHGGSKVAPHDLEANKQGDIEDGGASGMHLKFSGYRATSVSFFSNASALNPKAKESYGKLEQLYDTYQPHVGEGLQVSSSTLLATSWVLLAHTSRARNGRNSARIGASLECVVCSRESCCL